MKVRFGYVSTALSLWECSPSKTLTFTRWKAMGKEDRMAKLTDVTRQNLNNTLRMLHYNVAHEIELYRMSSSIVPLATHPEAKWDYRTIFKKELYEIGKFVKKHKLRVSLHPNQYTLFTSDKKQITMNAVSDMQYHYDLFEGMDLIKDDIVNINIHVGGAYGDKSKALERFHKNIKFLPKEVKQKTTLENDDKTYTAEETLVVCKKENISMVFDYHHHMANLSGDNLMQILADTFATWSHRRLPPKVHISSPKSEKVFRSHADYVSLDFIMPFLKATKELDIDYDIMIEAKQKDKALLRLVDEVSKVRGIKRKSGASIEW
ncbi:UV DNA damage repair endonuclease UvsE [Fredinandcohnia humi]